MTDSCNNWESASTISLLIITTDIQIFSSETTHFKPTPSFALFDSNNGIKPKGGQILNDLISSIKSVHVEEIYIVLYADVNKVACFVDYGAVIAQKAAYTWEGVDDALVSASFPVLRKVRLVCGVDHYWEQARPAIEVQKRC